MVIGCLIADLPNAVPVAKDIENRASPLRALSFAEPELVGAFTSSWVGGGGAMRETQ